MWRRTGKIVLILLPAVLSASEVTLTASVDRTEVGLGETLVLTVSVQGENIGDVPSPELPDLPDFDVLGRSSSQQTSIQLINGKMTRQQSIDFTYTLSPRRVGKASIGPVKLEYRGTTHETRVTEVNVVEGSTRRAPQPSSKSTAPGAEVPTKDNLKVVATANRREVYWGEEVVVEFALYSRVSIGDVDLVEAPTFNGFWVKPVYDAKRLNFQRKTLEGQAFDVCLLKKSALFPVSSGELKIGSMELNVGVVQRSRDFFDFFGRTRTIRVGSQPIDIEVKPLPTEGRPADFAGGVGEFTVTAALDRTSSEAAEPVNLTIRVEGRGNIPFIEKPTIPPIPGVRVLDPETGEKVEVVGDRIEGYREFRYPVIPQTDGEHRIPPVALSYFSPNDGAYHTLETEALRFTASQTATATQFVPSGGLKVLGDDIRHIKPDMAALRSERFTPPNWLFLFYIVSLCLIASSLVLRRHRAKLMTDRAYARRLRSNRRAKRLLKRAEACLRRDERQGFYSMLSKALLGYLGDRHDLDVHAMTKDALRGQLTRKRVRKAVIDETIDLLERCETACFSSNLMISSEPEELLRRVKKVVSRL